MKKMLMSLIICCATSVTAHGQTAGMSDITVLSVDVGRFEWGNKIIHVYENTRNQSVAATAIEKWQFVIEPLLSTRKTANGEIEYQKFLMDPLVVKHGKHEHLKRRNRVLVPLDLITNDARDRALDAITFVYPNSVKPPKDCRLGRSNVDILPLVEITISSSDIERPDGMMARNVAIAEKTQSFLTAPKQLFLKFDVWEKDNSGEEEVLDRFLKFLPFMQLDATVSFSVKSTKFNIAAIDIEKLKNTKLWIDLNGSGGVGTVSRHDLRTLAQEAAVSVRGTFTVEDPASFDQSFIQGLLSSARDVTADERFFQSEQGKSTYNADDLKPDTITKELNKVWTKDQGKDEWTLNTSSSANASFLDIISAGASGSLSTSKLKEWLKEHSIESDIQGNKIIAKSIALKQVNLSDFASRFNYGTEYRNVSGAKANLRTVIFGQPPAPNANPTRFPSLAEQCDNKDGLKSMSSFFAQ
ncbi:hypothetical protein J2R76_006469 [Bradyrhizobium sp. USDA 4532]|uniref:hypothetical protein n=1 Tax=unclassified Bradyrhizobium TaxID=2631580 RepID=UPI00209F4C77|nr:MULTISPECIES: hypothetical protein [unclassified Bradyrhizobium]MCP1829769.1 hypothetical protein [Bradyrhizobium sp. USDA 4545]MCP1922878.1 hypothetical protein [Bradyrhizobium sp. USDA 4532]